MQELKTLSLPESNQCFVMSTLTHFQKTKAIFMAVQHLTRFSIVAVRIHLHPNNCLVIIAISNERILQPSFLENRGMVVSITPTLHGVVDNFL